jgi:outer membrane immunogenic protein
MKRFCGWRHADTPIYPHRKNGLGRFHGAWHLKKILLASVTTIALFSAPAFAADMPVRTPVYKTPALYDPWTGFYAGGSIGARLSEVDWRSDTLTGGGAPIVGPNNPASLDNTSFRVGGYIGYNWKIGPAWLAGLEADIAWAENKKLVTPFPGVAGPSANFDTVKLGWDGSVRGRLGVLVSPTWLLYGTGGVAWQEIKTLSSCGTGGGFCGGGVTVSGTSSATKAGWTVGGGVETALPNNWLARAEYRYADFGHVHNTLPPAAVVGIESTINVKTHAGLIGLAYKY